MNEQLSRLHECRDGCVYRDLTVYQIWFRYDLDFWIDDVIIATQRINGNFLDASCLNQLCLLAPVNQPIVFCIAVG